MIGAEEKKSTRYFDRLIFDPPTEILMNCPGGEDLILQQLDEILSGEPPGTALTAETRGFGRLINRKIKGNPLCWTIVQRHLKQCIDERG